MSEPTVVVVSGYFNPLHIGHLRMLEAARALGDEVVVIVNNDRQQQMKKGKIIIPEDERCEIVAAIRHVDEVMLAVDEDRTVRQSLVAVAQRHAGKRIVFANGGDRSSGQVVPETEICEEHGIEMVFDLGGTEKIQSSSNILAALDLG